MPNNMAMSVDFLSAFARLPGQQQRGVRALIARFNDNSAASGLNYERINGAKDANMRSLRIDRGYRAIVLKPARGDVHVLLWADKHDDAYDWATRRRCDVNPESGAVQVYLPQVRLRERSRIVLKASSGLTNKEIAAQLGLEANMVGRWRKRYAEEGIAGIERERARGGNQGGRSDAERDALRSRIVEATTTRLPKDATQWSCRSMAREVGASRNFVNRTWRARGLKPHLSRTFKPSADPRFEEKLRDVVGLYLDPPENAAVFSFDEKSSIQALDRTQPGLPMKKGRCGTATHDYKRHGTTSLFAALIVVAEPRRALLRAALRAAAAARRVHFGVPLGEEHPAVSGHLQREPAAAGVDEVDRGDPRKSRARQGETGGSLLINIMTGTPH